MLRRPQADGILAARLRLVEGMVEMVESALIDISGKSRAVLDEAQRIALVSNLMTILPCDENSQLAMQVVGA
jgi:hypothetical protein